MQTAMEQKQNIRAQWASSARGWDRWLDWYVANFQPMFDWCWNAATVRRGRVLDVACGPGQPALTFARHLAASGSVIGVDIAPEMLKVARDKAAAAGVDNIDFQENDAEELDFEDASFDAVTCVCGLMFCPDAVKAVSEMRRVLKPDGRLTVVVWSEPAKNTFGSLLGGALGTVLNAPPPPANSPGAFRFADKADLEAVLRAGGFADIAIETFSMPITYTSVEQYMEITMDVAGGIKTKIEMLDASDRRRLDDLVRERAAPFLSDDGLHLVATPHCAVAVHEEQL